MKRQEVIKLAEIILSSFKKKKLKKLKEDRRLKRKSHPKLY